MANPRTTPDAIPTRSQAGDLYGLGAHFTVCGGPSQEYRKRKACRRPRWEAHRPPLDEVLRAIADQRWLGVIPASLGLAVVDIDEGDPEVVIAELGAPLATVRTGGGGTHLFYRAPGGEVGNRKWALDGAGGDVRGTKGYVLIWDGAKTLASATEVAEGRGAPLNLRTLPNPSGAPRRGPAAVRMARKGTRNDRLNREVYRDSKSGVLTEARMVEYRTAATAAGLDAPETEATLRSAARAGQPDESPATRESVEPLEAANIDWSAVPPPRRWLVDGLIPFGRLAALYGEGDGGKSRLLLQLALAVIRDEDGPMLPLDAQATGQADPKVPLAMEHGRTIILTWEDEVDEFRRRVALAGNAGAVPSGVTTARLEERLQIVDMRAVGGPLWAPCPDGSRHIATEGTWTEAGSRLLALMERDRPTLVGIDPLAAAYACSENSRPLVRRFLSSLDAAAEALGVTVLLTGHPSKSEGEYSGSTDWRNGARAMLTLGNTKTAYKASRPGGREKVEWVAAPCIRREKSNYGPSRGNVWLRSHWQPPDKKPGQLAWFATDEHSAALAVRPDTRTGSRATRRLIVAP